MFSVTIAIKPMTALQVQESLKKMEYVLMEESTVLWLTWQPFCAFSVPYSGSLYKKEWGAGEMGVVMGSYVLQRSWRV